MADASTGTWQAGTMGDRLRDKIVIVTGAGQGIGRAAAKRLAEEGATVAIVDANEAGANRTLEDLAGTDADVFIGDLREYAVAEELARWAHDRWGRIDVLVNNVGGATQFKPFHEWQPEEMLAEVHLSLLPTLWCCRAVLPLMIARGRGRIVNVGAESVRNGLWDRAPYSAGKGGVHALTTSLALETAELGITCNTVAPAATNSQRDRLVQRGGRTLSAEEQAHFNRLGERTLATIPLGRYSEVEEQAAAIAFFASDDSSFVTGQCLFVNGGSSN